MANRLEQIHKMKISSSLQDVRGQNLDTPDGTLEQQTDELYRKYLGLPRFKGLNMQMLTIAYLYKKTYQDRNVDLDTEEDDRVIKDLLIVFKTDLTRRDVYLKHKVDFIRYIYYINRLL